MTSQPSKHIRLRPLEDHAWWDGFVRGHRGGTPFHLSGFLVTYARLSGQELVLAQALLEGDPVGVVPLLIRRRGPFVLLNHGLAVPYLDPLLLEGISVTDLLPAIRRHLRPWTVARYTVRSIQDLAVPDDRSWRSLSSYRRAVLRVAGPDQEDVTATFDAKQRAVVRRAERAGLVTEPATRQELRDSMTGWANAPYLRQGLPPAWPEGAHLAICDALAPEAVSARAVRRDGQVVAMAVNLRLNERLIGWEMGLSDAGRKAGASTLLIADGLRHAREIGCTEYDLLGTPTPGIAAFKRSLGADLLPYSAAQWTCAPLGAMPWAQQMLRKAV